MESSPTSCTRKILASPTPLRVNIQVHSLSDLYDGPPAGKHTQKTEIDHLDWLSHPPNCFGGRGTVVLGSLAPEAASDIACQNEGDTAACPLEHDQSNECSKLLRGLPPQRVACTSGDIACCGSTYRQRSPRISVSKKLFPLTTLAGADFVKAWLEVVKFHAYSWNNGLEYGDPCLRNMMYDDSLECGVLTDHDTSISLQDARVLRIDRAAAMPFMASELLTGKYWRGKVARHYRHELEAFIWILAFVFLAYQNKKIQRGTLVEKWMTSDYNNCRIQKRDFQAFDRLSDHEERCQADSIQHWPLPRHLLEWLNDLAREVNRAKSNLPADYNSVDGLWPRFTAELDNLPTLDSSSFMDYLPGLIAELELHGILNIV